MNIVTVDYVDNTPLSPVQVTIHCDGDKFGFNFDILKVPIKDLLKGIREWEEFYKPEVMVIRNKRMLNVLISEFPKDLLDKVSVIPLA